MHRYVVLSRGQWNCGRALRSAHRRINNIEGSRLLLTWDAIDEFVRHRLERHAPAAREVAGEFVQRL